MQSSKYYLVGSEMNLLLALSSSYPASFSKNRSLSTEFFHKKSPSEEGLKSCRINQAM